MDLVIFKNMAKEFIQMPIAAFSSGVIAYFMPMYEVFAVLILFVTVDLAVGLLASRKRGIPCNSRRLRISVSKLSCYVIAVLLPYMAEKAFGIEWLASYKLIGGFIVLVEFISILENLAMLTEKLIFLKIIKLIRGKLKENNEETISNIVWEKNSEEHDSPIKIKEETIKETSDKK